LFLTERTHWVKWVSLGSSGLQITEWVKIK
jgi:hypothetical protein